MDIMHIKSLNMSSAQSNTQKSYHPLSLLYPGAGDNKVESPESSLANRKAGLRI
jgi:hypothetical protein